MTDNKHMIWESAPDMEPLRSEIREQYPDISDASADEMIWDQLDEDFTLVKNMLNTIEPENGILAYATLGLWNRTPTAVLKDRIPTTAGDCLRSYVTGWSEIEFFVSETGELSLDETHHDGCNHYIFRGWKPNVNDDQKEALMNALYMQKDYHDMLQNLTYRLGDLVGDIYGWEYPDRPAEATKAG